MKDANNLGIKFDDKEQTVTLVTDAAVRDGKITRLTLPWPIAALLRDTLIAGLPNDDWGEEDVENAEVH